MTDRPTSTPSFQDLLAISRDSLARLAELGDSMSRQLAERGNELSQLRGELARTQGELARAREALTGAGNERNRAQQELEQVRGGLQKAHVEVQQARQEFERLRAELEKLRTDAQALAAENQALSAKAEGYQAQLAEVHGERDELKALHGHVTDQAARLASDWNARRQALTADSQRLAADLESARKTLVQGQERERQWKAQVFKLQDDVGRLREAAGHVTLSAEQGHHLYSQLNAIIGFADVLLDEGGNRATAAERQEFLQHIKDSGTKLADELRPLIGDGNQTGAAEPRDQRSALEAAPASATPILVAAEDETLRERIQSFLDRAGYRVEFTADAQAAMQAALQLQPLAIMIDTGLSQNQAQRLADELSGEARTRDIPVVLVVANDDEPLGMSMGQHDFLKKPINRQQVLQIMTKYDLLAERRRVSKMPTSVLVIDDDPRNTRLVQAMLKPFNVDVLVANDGNAGIKLARARRPDLIILDLMMSEVDGFAVVSELRSDSTTAQTPILIYTAKNLTGAERQLLQGNIQAIVRKGELSKERFLELVYRRGERRQPRAADEAAA